MSPEKIFYNKPFFNGLESEYIEQAISNNFIASGGPFTERCKKWFASKLKLKNTYLTTSCTDALEMCALLLDLKEGDEVIMPSYAFVSIANAFILHGATIKFVDSNSDHPNLNVDAIVPLISDKTKAVVAIHYAGMAVDLEKLSDICKKHNLVLIEDAAHSIAATYEDKSLGSYGDLATFSFHESKNITCGEGGCLVVNNHEFIDRAEILLEKGTNRAQFRKGKVNMYEWLDKGASYGLSDLNAAMLLAQLEKVNEITERRKRIWNRYYMELLVLESTGKIQLPKLESYMTGHNAHIFYFLTKDKEERNLFIEWINKQKIWCVFHYLPLHSSPYFKDKYRGKQLKNADKFGQRLVRIPLHLHLEDKQLEYIMEHIHEFYRH